MRFNRLNLKAYGPFTNQAVELGSNDTHDLNIIYGENEAGKSSLLRAISNTLFPMPTKFPDNFLHDYKNLRVGATISRKGDEKNTFSFLRKKGLKNTLLNEDEEVIDDERLLPFLGSATRDQFTQKFGLNTLELRNGAAALLNGTSSTGDILFSASQGSASISESLKTLSKEADALFKSRHSKNLTIYALLNKIKELKTLLETQSLKPERYKESIETCNSLQDQVTQAAQEIKALERQIQNITNTQNALPVFLDYQESKQNLTRYNHLPEVSSDFPARLREQEAQYIKALQNKENTVLQLTAQRKRLTSLETIDLNDADLLEIETLDRQEGLYLANLSERQILQRRLQEETAHLTELLTDLQLTSYEELPPAPRKTEEIQVLRTLKALKEQTEEHARALKEKHKLTEEYHHASERLSELGSTTDLLTLHTLYKQAQEHDVTLRANQRLSNEISSSEQEIHTLRSALEFAPQIETSAILEHSLPTTETYRALSQKQNHAEQTKQRHENNLYALKKELNAQTSSLSTLKEQTELYTPQELQQTRAERNALLEQAIQAPSDATVLLKLKVLTVKADTIVDTLSADSKRQIEASKLKHDILHSQQDIQLLEDEIKNSNNTLKETSSEWEALFQSLPIPPPSINEFPNISAYWQDLKEAYTGLRTQQQVAHSLTLKTESLYQTIMKSGLTPQAADFSEASLHLTEQQQTLTQEQALREEYQTQVHNVERELSTIDQRLNELSENVQITENEWLELSEKLELETTQKNHEEIDSLLSTRKEARAMHESLKELERHLEEKFIETEHFEAARTALTQNTITFLTSHNLSNTNTEAQWVFLKSQRKKANELKSQSSILQTGLDTTQESIQKAENTLTLEKQKLSMLLQTASITENHEIEPFLQALEQKKQTLSQLSAREKTLKSFFPTDTLNKIETTLSETNIDDLKISLDTLTVKRDLLQEKRDQLLGSLNEAESVKRDYEKTSQDAADTQQELESTYTELKAYSKRYLTLKAAIEFLTAQVEAYRKKNQGPMIQYTSEYFTQLTLGKYTKVIDQPDNNDTPKLYAVRASSKEPVEVAHLSEGTADQLYLALRLAALKMDFKKRPPLPLILDDILMTFDDERSKAVLQVLKDFSSQTQVLIFTHHASVKRLAEEVKAHVVNL